MTRFALPVRFSFTARSACLLALAAFAALMASTGSASATLTLCNKTSYVIETSIAYEYREGHVSQGWWTIYPGDCRAVIQQELDPEISYFTFARAIRGHLGGIKAWGGRFPFCTGSGRFQRTEHRACPEGADIKFDFAYVNHKGQTSWTTDFSEPQKYSAQKAKIAGAQRLLRDLSFNNQKIDGIMGDGTKRAVRKAKKEFGLPRNDDLNRELFLALSRRANSSEAETGLELCNTTGETVWAAIATAEDEADPISKGWYKLEAGDCAKAIKDELKNRFFYTYAETEDKEGQETADRLTWGGNRFFCVNAVMFAIEGAEDCALRGFEPRGFRRIDTQGDVAWKEFFKSDNTSVPIAGMPPAIEAN
ncbi:MAG: DUF1036 domain-containing protein [Pseudomonadota bacterium]